MFSFLNSLTNLTTNVVNIVMTPVEASLELGVAATQPLVTASEKLVEDIKDSLK